jgi:hypothetical protein
MSAPTLTPLMTYSIRRLLMHSPLIEHHERPEPGLRAEVELRARRLRALRRLERIERQLRLARLRLQ